MLRGEDVLFVGLGKTVPSWYRCALPAYHLGARWIGYAGEPPRGAIATGNTMSGLGGARVYVLQQVRGDRWLRFIRDAKASGARVLYEVDDNLRGVDRFTEMGGGYVRNSPARIAAHERCMSACDGIICSTDFLASEYSDIGRTFVCRNGIDVERFDCADRRASRDGPPSVGWFGGAGHEDSVRAWAGAVAEACNELGLTFYSIGHQYREWSAVARLVRIPFVGIECVPDALANVDIGLAPWADTPFYAGKSDLRFLEGSASGMAMLCDQRGYGPYPINACWYSDDDGVYSWLRTLAEDPEARRETAATGYDYVRAERSASATAGDWEKVLSDIDKEMS